MSVTVGIKIQASSLRCHSTIMIQKKKSLQFIYTIHQIYELHSTTQIKYTLSEKVSLNSRLTLASSRISLLEAVTSGRRCIVGWLSVNNLAGSRRKREATRKILTRRKGLLQHRRV